MDPNIPNGSSAPRLGVKVADFSTHVSGPLASHILCELGADIVKVENPRNGDTNRPFPPIIEGFGLYHVSLNAGTRSIAIDVHSPHWPAVVDGLAKWADVAIVGQHGDDARSLGLHSDNLLSINPKLVHCSITGYGQHGPWQHLRGHGLHFDAYAGIVPLEELPGGRIDAARTYQTSGTSLAGVHAALGILAALRRRDISGGEGQVVRTSIWQSAMWINWRNLTTFVNIGQEWLKYQDLGSRYATYRTLDDRAIAVAPIHHKFWAPFCAAIGRPEWADRGHWTDEIDKGDGPEYEAEREELAEIFRSRPLSHWMEALDQTTVPFAPFITWQEAVGSDHAAANHVLTHTSVGGEEIKLVALPVSVNSQGEEAVAAGEGAPVFAPPPELGRDTDEILDEIGLSELATEVRSAHPAGWAVRYLPRPAPTV